VHQRRPGTGVTGGAIRTVVSKLTRIPLQRFTLADKRYIKKALSLSLSRFLPFSVVYASKVRLVRQKACEKGNFTR